MIIDFIRHDWDTYFLIWTFLFFKFSKELLKFMMSFGHTIVDGRLLRSWFMSVGSAWLVSVSYALLENL